VGSVKVGEGVEAAASHSATERDHMCVDGWWWRVLGGGREGLLTIE
jgi:hypothetical protein